MSQSKRLILGVDATNLRRGGSVTHLVELLRAAQPNDYGIGRVIVWGGKATLDALEDRPWLDKHNPPLLNRGLFHRSWWQTFCLSKEASEAGCDVLFVPGGNYAGDFHPVVTMSRNMLPFEWRELRRYGWSLMTLKLLLLRLFQSYTFRKVDGLIFLTDYARRSVLGVTGAVRAKMTIIPHGVNTRFFQMPKPQREIGNYSDAKPYRLLYVSTIDQYKHQWHVVEAVAALRKEGYPVILNLIGPAYSPALKKLESSMARFDPDRARVHYHGPISFNTLHQYYTQAHLGIFASSCENMPNILLETMASGLPIACSNRGPMPEVLGDAGVYFDPEQPANIAQALRKLIDSPYLRRELAEKSYRRAQQYSWERCARETLAFIRDCWQDYMESTKNKHVRHSRF